MVAETDVVLNRLLFQYDLYPYRITPFERVYKIETDRGLFALKKKKLTVHQIEHLKVTYQLSQNLVIDAVTPLPSKYGDLVISGDGETCYLMPWIEETVPVTDLKERYRMLFIKAGQMHRATMRRDTQNSDDLYAQLTQIAMARKQEWEGFLNVAEHHVYPSPFEQVVFDSAGIRLSHIQQAMTFFSRGEPKDEEGKGIGMRRALCHGRLNPRHLLIERERCLLVNLEECREDFFILETASLMEQACVMYNGAPQWEKWLHDYLTACPLREEEGIFLFHLMLCPKAPSLFFNSYLTEKKKDEPGSIRKWMRFSRNHKLMLSSLWSWLEKEKKQAEAASPKEAE
ncbi:spore coat protein YsxE [Sporolactobacillus sp. Y61]|uniref:Spore coat protein YsxE n=2 Tax=unclassified Sporolactobacillus TaxID=2628533 RepID=A0AAU8IF62_9BACL